MNRALPALIVLFLAACNTDGWRPGTGVGNPGSSTPALSRVAGLVTQEATATVKALVAERCNGDVVRTDVNRVVDLLDPDPLELGGGELCAVELQLQSRLTFRARQESGADPIELEIPIGEVRLLPVGVLAVDGGAYVLELGDGEWYDPASPEEDLANVGAAIAASSSLYLDVDDDGVISESERDVGALAASEDDDETEDGEGNGDGDGDSGNENTDTGT